MDPTKLDQITMLKLSESVMLCHTGILPPHFVSQELERQAAEAAAQAEKAAGEADGQAKLQSIKAVHQRTLQPPAEFESLLSFQNQLLYSIPICAVLLILVLLKNCHDE